MGALLIALSAMDLQALAHRPFVYVTTTGRTSGQPREIEIWFVVADAKIYIFAEHGQAAHWVQNIAARSGVRVRLGDEESDADARIVDPASESVLCARIRPLMQQKYGWSDGLPVEIRPR